MPSALIPAARSQPAVPLARQLAHQRCVRPGPLVLGAAPLKSPTPTTDRDRHVCYPRAAGAARWPGHFCLALHVAMQVGPSLHHSSIRRAVFGVWSLRIPMPSSDALDDTGHLHSWRGPASSVIETLLSSGVLLSPSRAR